MDPHHRKIDLQSPADLTYLHNNIKNAAQQKLDLAIPPQGEDAFRTKVQDLVQEVVPPKQQRLPLCFNGQRRIRTNAAKANE